MSNVNYGPNPYADVFRKIGYCRANSNDPNFHAYLDQKLEQAEKGLVTPDALMYDIDVNFGRYQQYAKNMANQTQTASQNETPVETIVSQPANEQPVNKEPVNAKPVVKASKTKGSFEYKIGAGVLSVIGAVFILIAFINFGKYFLDDVFEGFMIYAAGAIIILGSELLFNTRIPVFSRVLTGLGFGVLYFATIFSCSKLKLFPVWVALIILSVTAIINIVLARIRKSQIIDIIATLGTASSIFTMLSNVSDDELLMIAGLILFLNVLMFIKPYDKANTVSTMTRLSVLFVVSMTIRLLKDEVNADAVEILVYVLLAVFVIFICYIFNTKNMLIKSFSLSFIGILLATVILGEPLGLDKYTYVWAGGITAISIIAFVSMIKKKEKWSAYSVFIISMVFTGIACKDQMVSVLVVIACVLVSKFLFAVQEVQVIDCVVSTLGMLTAIAYHEQYLSYLLVAILIIGSIMNTRFKLYHEFMLLLGGLIFTISVCSEKFFLAPVLMLVCYLFILMFNLIPVMKVKGIIVFNIIALAIMGFVAMIYPFITGFGKLIDLFNNTETVKVENVIAGCAIMAIGVVAILTVFTKKFNMYTSAKYLILAVFLTYTAFSLDVEEIWRSVALMAIAFIMIAVGCFVNKFSLRLYGLILSLLVCLKVAFYDFREGTELTRMIVFLIIGLLAIAISLTYLTLEKHERKQMMAAAANGSVNYAPNQAVNNIQPTANPVPAVNPEPVVNEMPVQDVAINETEIVVSTENLGEPVINTNVSGEETNKCDEE